MGGRVRLETSGDELAGVGGLTVPEAPCARCVSATHEVRNARGELRGFDRLRNAYRDDRGGVLALVALFLPVAIMAAGMVADLGMVFVARKAVQSACDLGALAGVIELDWDRLAEGEVRLREEDAEDIATSVARQNLDSALCLVEVRSLTSRVRNPPEVDDPVVQVEARYTVALRYLGRVPGLRSGFQGTVFAEASVVERTKW